MFRVTVQSGENTLIPLILPSLAPGMAFMMPINVIPGNVGDVRISARVGRPLVEGPDFEWSPEWAKCVESSAVFLGNVLGLAPGGGCAKSVILGVLKELRILVNALNDHSTGQQRAVSRQRLLISAIRTALGTLTGCAVDLNPILKVITYGIKVEGAIESGFQVAEDCKKACGASESPGSGGLTGRVVASIDPNDKAGSPGVTASRFVAGTQSLSYMVSFENLPTATAAAQDVVITDQLDASKVDLATFQLGAITFADKYLNPPVGAQSFSGSVDLRPANNLIANVNANLDLGTGLITWRFRSLDPATGLPTTDPLAGFLPPNTAPPEGQRLRGVFRSAQSRTGERVSKSEIGPPSRLTTTIPF